MTFSLPYIPWRLGLASLFLAPLLCAPAKAAEPEAGALAAALENPETRAQLITQLKALAAAQQAAPPSAEVGLFALIAEKAGDLRIGLGSLAIIAIAILAAKLLHKVVDKALASGGPHRRLVAVHRAFRALIGGAGLLALAQLWGFQPMSLLNSELGQRLASTAVHLAVVIVGAMVAWHLLHGAIERYLTATDSEGNLLQRSGRARTLLPLVRNAAFILLSAMTILIALSELGVDIAPLLAGAGVLGIAVGFGSQKLVQDIITGAFILFEDTIAVGDVVNLGGPHAGTVEAISIRAIRLRDSNGSLHTVPFSAVSTVINAAKGFNYAVFDVGISYSEDTDRVAAIMAELGAELQADPHWSAFMAEPLEVQGVERFDASAVIMRARVKTTPGDRFALGREFNRRVKMRFDAEGIEMPFPQMKVWMAEKA